MLRLDQCLLDEKSNITPITPYQYFLFFFSSLSKMQILHINPSLLNLLVQNNFFIKNKSKIRIMHIKTGRRKPTELKTPTLASEKELSFRYEETDS